MQRVLVTGGAGFVGSNLALELEQLGYEVTVADHHLSTASTSLKNFRGKTIKLDVSQNFDVDGSYSAIFHQAALTDPRHPDDKEIYDRNLSGFQNVLDYCGRQEAALIYASTAGLYGNGPVPMKEDQEKDILTSYGKSKLKMDEIAESYFNKMHIVGLRYFNVFGPREAHKGRPASMIYHLSQQMKQGLSPRLFRYGEHQRDFIYVKDVVKANLCALKAPSGVYNVGTGVGVTFNSLVETLNAVLGTQLSITYFDMPFESKTYQHHTIADVTWAKEKLGFTADWKLKEAVQDYMDWLNQTD